MLMPIGRFARATRLSVRSLRNYHESGLLPAAFVDPESGYRYYRLEQYARAETIRSLRLMDMPLAQIAEVLEAEDPEPVLLAHLASLEHQRDTLDRMARLLRRHIYQEDYTMSSEVQIRTNPAMIAVGHRTETTYPGIFDDIPAGFEVVMAFLVKAGIDPVGAPFTVYYQAPDGDNAGDIAMCIPVSAAAATNDETEVIEIAAGATACLTHQGSYDDMGRSYHAVAEWIHERGHRIVGPHREVYLNSPADTAEEDLLTEIVFPIDAEAEAEF